MCRLLSTSLNGEEAGRHTRLGICYLGWHANEEQMPARILHLLSTRPLKATSNLIPALAAALEADSQLQRAYLCDPATEHVGKVSAEGANFCAYHNIQMLMSFIIAAASPGHESLPESVPGVLKLQDMIEHAWDSGFSAQGRAQTGGIKGTRKHIGTQEADALFRSLDIACSAHAFADTKTEQAWRQLLDFVWRYFDSVPQDGPMLANGTNGRMSVQSGRPPIFLQRPRHSMTIVGIEQRRDGTRDLLVFDPGTDLGGKSGKALLAACRRGRRKLMPHRAFELLCLIA